MLANLYSQQYFQPFNDISKQLEFERNRIYVEKSERSYSIPLFSGYSETSLGNPLEYYFLNQDPVIRTDNYGGGSIQNVVTSYKITYQGREINELDLLKIVGLENELNRIIKNYNLQLKQYNNKIEKYKQSGNSSYRKFTRPLEGGIDGLLYVTIGVTAIIRLIFAIDENSMCTDGYDPDACESIKGSNKSMDKVMLYSALLLFIDYTILRKEVILEESDYDIKRKFPEPVFSTGLSNNQINGIINSYNTNLYNLIKRK